jgi:hypothetical protein
LGDTAQLFGSFFIVLNSICPSYEAIQREGFY